MIANKDYDRRWYCGSCGQTWTPQSSAIFGPSNDDNTLVKLRELSKATAIAARAPKLSWTFLPPDVENKRIRVQAECSCGQVIQYDDDWTDNAKVICVKCGSDHGTYSNYKAQARTAVDDFIAGNVSKYRIKL